MDVEARLRAFAAVARAGSFSRAAERLYVSQPAVSKHVASLEAELATQLVVRARGGVTLTPAGQMLADYVLRAEALLANARRALAAGADAERGVLALAASGIPGTYLLPPLLSSFHDRYPAVELDFRVETSGGVLELVRAHTVELAVVGGMTLPPELESEALIEDQVVLIGPRELGGRRLRLKDLEGKTWLTREEGSATRAAVEAARWQSGLRAVRELELPSWEAVKLAVANGAGIAAVSRFALDVELEAGRLAILDVPRWRLSRTVSVVWARDVPLTPPAERFRGVLRRHFQVAQETAPPNSNLPPAPGALIGRRRELAQIDAALRAHRLVTLAGAGGCGKTRLALAAGARQIDLFKDGVYFVDLTPLRDATRVHESIAGVVGATDAAALPERLGQESALLVLDNFERVLDAAPAVADLLDMCPAVQVLVTSRAPLRVRYEHVLEIEPLELDEAVALFVETAGGARDLASDDSVRRLCARVDCLPLAVELAAVRSNLLAPVELLQRLERSVDILTGGRRDVDARQKTLYATIEWSCDLLSPEALAVFKRLSAFVGGCTFEAAERVADATAETLSELMEQHLLRRDDNRFLMLDTIHLFAAEQLQRSGESDEVQRRHALYLAQLSEEAAPHLRGATQSEWFDRLRVEAENVRAAMEWTNARRERELQLRLAGAAWQYWIGLGDWKQWRTWLDDALGDVDEPELRLLAVRPRGWLALRERDYERAQRFAEERRELGEQTASPADVVGAYTLLAQVAEARGNVVHAAQLSGRAVDLDRAAGDETALVSHLANHAGLLFRGGDVASARAAFQEARQLALSNGDQLVASELQLDLAAVELADGRPREALALAAPLLPEFVRHARSNAVWNVLEFVGAALVGVGRTAEGVTVLGTAETIRLTSSDELTGDVAERRTAALLEAREQLGESGLAAATAQGRTLDAGAAAQLALRAIQSSERAPTASRASGS